MSRTSAIAMSLMLSMAQAGAAPAPITDSFAGIYHDLEAQAAKSNPEAQTCLAGMYLHALGVPMDREKAMGYLKMAADQGDVAARLSLTSIYGVSGQHTAHLAGLKEAQKLAEQGVPEAEFFMGMVNLYGSELTGKPDYAAALIWLKKASALGRGDAAAMVGAIYRHGWGVAPDPQQARIWLEKAAQSSFSCPAGYADLVQYLIQANLDYPADVKAGKIGGQVVVRVPFEGGKVGAPVIMVPSGQSPLDQAVQHALDGLSMPSWTGVPSGMGGINLILYFAPGTADPQQAYR